MGTYPIIGDSCRTSTLENRRIVSLSFDAATSPNTYSNLCSSNNDGVVVSRSDISNGFTSYGIAVNNPVYAVPYLGSDSTWSA